MTFKLDGAAMTDRAAAHDHLKERLDLPDYYGRNLDALYDLLTERLIPITIVMTDRGKMEAQLGDYGRSLTATLKDAAQENAFLEIEFI